MKNFLLGLGIVGFVIFYIVAALCALAPTALAVWALGHFAFGWW